jgi:cytochrome c-type biogenesis protein CcmH
MVLAALALILRPLLSDRPLSALDQRDVNLTIYHRRLQELEADQATGLLTEAAATEAKLELQRQLLGDLGPEPAAPARRRPAYRAAAVVGVLLPVAVLALYLHLGSLGAEREMLAAASRSDGQDQVAFIREHLGELQAKVRAEPGNLEAVLMLGRAYLVLEQYDVAVDMYAASEPWAGGQVAFLVDYAEAVAYAQGGSMLGKPVQLLQQGLGIDPDFPKGLWLAGLAAIQADQPERARQYWEKLVAILPPESEPAAQLRQVLAEIGGAPATPEGQAEHAAAAAVSLQVDVSLSPELAQTVAAGSTVFVLARPADGQRTPLAAIRRTVGQFPFSVVLDESMAMVSGMSLREFPQVVVEARVSRSGDAASQPGDLIGRSEPVSTTSGDAVTIVIDRLVE